MTIASPLTNPNITDWGIRRTKRPSFSIRSDLNQPHQNDRRKEVLTPSPSLIQGLPALVTQSTRDHDHRTRGPRSFPVGPQ